MLLTAPRSIAKSVTTAFSSAAALLLSASALCISISTVGVNAAVVFNDDFNGATLDSGKWTEYRGGADIVTVTNGTVHFASKTFANTCGKYTFNGTDGIVVESRMAGPGGLRDTHMELIEVNSGDLVQAGDTNYTDGLYTYGSGQFFSAQAASGGSSTAAMMEYRMTLNGTTFKIERGTTLANLTQSRTITLPSSVVGKTFFLRIGTGGPDYQPGDFEWVRVDAAAGAVNSNCNASGSVTPLLTPWEARPQNGTWSTANVSQTSGVISYAGTLATTYAEYRNLLSTPITADAVRLKIRASCNPCSSPNEVYITLSNQQAQTNGGAAAKYIGLGAATSGAADRLNVLGAITSTTSSFSDTTAYHEYIIEVQNGRAIYQQDGATKVNVAYTGPLGPMDTISLSFLGKGQFEAASVAVEQLSAAAVSGTCGTANNVAAATAPTTNLCATGTATPVTGTGPWSWTCNGSGGGTNASCSAPTLGTPDFYVTAQTIAPTDTTTIIHLPPAVAPTIAFTVACTSSNPAVVTLESETIYPSWGTGTVRVTGTVVRAQAVGSAIINCGGYAHPVTVLQPTVTSITPNNTLHGRPTRFDIVGTNLQNHMRFTVESCDGDSVEIDPQNGTSFHRVFECSPNAPVSLNSLVTLRLLRSAVNLNTLGYRYVTTWVNPCPDNPEALALARQQFGSTTLGASYGSIPWLTMNYQDVVSLENLLRTNGTCLAFDADLSAKMRRELSWQSEALNNELELVSPTASGWLQAFAANVTAAEYLDYSVKSLVSVVKIAGSPTVLATSKHGSLKGMSRLTYYFKRNGVGLSKRAADRLAAMKKLQDLLEIVSLPTSVAATGYSAAKAGFAPEEMAELQDAANDLVVKGIMNTTGLKQLTNFLEGTGTLGSLYGEGGTEFVVGVIGRMISSGDLTDPALWNGIGEDALDAVISPCTPCSGALDLYKDTQALANKGVGRAFARFEEAQAQYDRGVASIMLRYRKANLAARFVRFEQSFGRFRTMSPSVDFGLTRVGSTTQIQVAFKNTGTVAATAPNFVSSDGRVLVGVTTCGSSVPAGASCSVSLTFNPVDTTPVVSLVRATSSFSGAPEASWLSVTGKGMEVAGESGTQAILKTTEAEGRVVSLTLLSDAVGSDNGCRIDRARLVGEGAPLLGTTTPVQVPLVPSKFPYGFVDFKLSGCNLGASQTIRIEYPVALPPRDVVKMWKRWDNGTSIETLLFGSPGLPLDFTVSGNVLTYTVTDGGPGDMDRTMNGVIVDPAGVSFSCSLALSGGAQPSSGDGMLLLRYLMGFRGAALTAGLTLGSRNSPAAIASFLGSAVQYDPLGRAPIGGPAATVEGLVLLRLMLGFPDTALLSGIAVPEAAQFKTGFDIRANVNSLCGTAY
jgi:hypothetical protein